MGGRGAAYRSKSGGASNKKDEQTVYDVTYKTGNGSVITEKSRIELSETNKQEKEKYNKEFEMCKDLADNGHTVIHLDDRKLSDGSYDILLDGRKTDLKRMKGNNNVYREGKSAIQDQGADLVVFKFDKINPNVHSEINKLKLKDMHGYYYEEGIKKMYEF